MPWHHRYIGNPLLSGFLNLLFHTGVDDAHCGMRALRRDVLPRLDLRTTGMEFASEMVIRAAKEKLDVRQFADRVSPPRRRVEALELPRRLAPPAVPAGPLAQPPVHPPRRGDGGARCDHRADRDRAPGRVRPRLGHPRPDRRRAAGDRRHPGRGARDLRARLRHVLHGRAGPLVRPDARPLQARARPAARRRDRAGRLRDRRASS